MVKFTLYSLSPWTGIIQRVILVSVLAYGGDVILYEPGGVSWHCRLLFLVLPRRQRFLRIGDYRHDD